jgi:hypothetical protein
MHLKSIMAAAHGQLRIIAPIAALAFAIQTTQAISLSLNPTSQTAPPGGFFDIFVELQIDGLGDGAAPSLGAFDLVLNFNPLVLNYQSTAFGSELGPVMGAFTVDMPNQSLGTLNLFGISLDTPDDLNAFQPGAFTIATMKFTPLLEGVSALDITDIVVGDADGVPFQLDSVRNASVTVATASVPEGELAGSGLFLLAFTIASTHWLRRRQTKS